MLADIPNFIHTSDQKHALVMELDLGIITTGRKRLFAVPDLGGLLKWNTVFTTPYDQMRVLPNKLVVADSRSVPAMCG
ncbi:hypothetical protein [Pseudovibrio sp. Tun.PSC04-5.I4]|uniref:hypothetical protein n=1 Tax=Pseudovibrio sp. Tun.PSC04-5.I4 TaxID=1798213 RepID=UPI00087EA46E|nr:hypothetical protein [Pseudovibrio sp. Tun.PSC04-5.I4]SDR01193.1 hypothetical protein SAMN04515695_2307 [Pseudovibrio sp. Tun.PSC04-5.I4]